MWLFRFHRPQWRIRVTLLKKTKFKLLERAWTNHSLWVKTLLSKKWPANKMLPIAKLPSLLTPPLMSTSPTSIHRGLPRSFTTLASLSSRRRSISKRSKTLKKHRTPCAATLSFGTISAWVCFTWTRRWNRHWTLESTQARSTRWLAQRATTTKKLTLLASWTEFNWRRSGTICKGSKL